MEAEIIFSGLCSFLNVRDVNPTMPEPSVILVRTNGVDVGTRSVDDEFAFEQLETVADEHIPYIAFKTADVDVDVLEGGALFEDVPRAEGFQFLRLDGVELKIENDPPGQPVVDRTYDRVVKKDDYWPEASNVWNRDFVPERTMKPKKTVVVGFMRFGTGKIAAGKMARVEWSFARPGMEPHRGRFAEEVIYSGFPHSGESVVVHLTDLETGELQTTLRFSAKAASAAKLTLFVGNNDVGDIDNAVQRRIPPHVPDNDHFLFLNQVALLDDEGPVPTVVRPAVFTPIRSDLAGGHSSGPCGPNSSNG